MLKKELDEIQQLLVNAPLLAAGGKEERVKKAMADFKYAVDTYFPHHVDFQKKETSKFRNFIYNNIDDLFSRYRNLEFEAYRGAAKTTMLERLLVLWLNAIKGEKRNTVIISSTLDVSEETLEFIKTELEENANLVHDFDITTGDKIGLTWKKTEIVFKRGNNKFRVKVYGAGKKIRGANWLGHRPDLIIAGDIENDENVEASDQRDKLYKWFNKAIKKLPRRKNPNYHLLVIGTRLHHDGLTARVSKRNDFQSFIFPLVLEFPEHLSEITKENVKKSDIKGMKLDDTSLDRYEILLEYLEDSDSFYSEYQMQPLSKENAVFKDYKTYKGEMPKCDMYAIGLDPALGKKNGALFGVAVLGYKASTKQFYLKTFGYRRKPIQLLNRFVKLYKKYDAISPTIMCIETVQFQEFYKDVLKLEAKKQEIFMSIKEIKNSADKYFRIETLAPPISDETILVNEDDILFVEELDTYPKAPHVDILDAAEMAWRGLKSKGKIDHKIVQKVFRNLRTLRISKYS